jgi:hypothetical protein
MQKVFFLHIFAWKQTFDRIFSLLETRLSPFESWFSRASASTNHRPTGGKFVWACAKKINMATYIRSVSWIYLVLKLIKQHFNERKLCNI